MARPEVPRLSLFALVHFLMGVGYSLGFYSASALLISRVGTAPLLYLYFAASIAALLLAGLFYYGTQWKPRELVVYLTYLGSGLLVILAWAAVVAMPDRAAVYLGMRAGFYAILVVCNLAFWLLASDAFNNFEARRSFSLLVAAGVFGELIGGWLVNRLAVPIGAVHLILGWGLLLCLCPLLFWGTRTLLPALFPQEAAVIPDESGSLHLTADTQSLLTEPLTLCVFSFWLIYSFLCYGTDYVFNSYVVRTLVQEDHLAAFFGQITWMSSLAILLYQLCIAGPLTMRLGVDRTILMIPLLLLLGLSGYLVAPSLVTIAVAQGTIYYFADYAAIGLLQPMLTVYPLGQRSAVRVLTEGLGRPIGTFCLLLLSLLLPRPIGIQTLLPLLIVGSFGFLALLLWFHRIYVAHLMRSLHSPDRELVVNAIQALGEPNKICAVKPLLRLLEQAQDIQLKQTVVLSLAQMQSMEAFQKIVSLFSVRDESLQMAVLQALGLYKNYEGMFALFRILKSHANVSYEIRMNAMLMLTRLVGRKIIPFVMTLLEDDNHRVVANAIESIGVLRDPQTIRILQPYLHHDHHRIRANAAIALHAFRATREAALQTIQDLYHARATHPHCTGLYAIGVLRLRSYRSELRQLLGTAADKQIRHFTALALALMGDPSFAKPFIQFLLDPDETFAHNAARRLGMISPASRNLVFEHIAKLTLPEQKHVYKILDHTPLDFSREKRLISSRKLMPVPMILQ